MYRVYVLCLTYAVVLGSGDEAKYIDLLPEAEKQEFLNRIARRIIEEIQGKGSPEQSNVEVSDDQLNTHNTYVQDLIKEESENLRNERRNYNLNDVKEADNEEPEKYIAEEQTNRRNDKKSPHIDLTLRNEEKRENITENVSEESTASVIPVKVIYDQEYFTTNNPGTPSEVVSSSSKPQDSTNTETSSISNIEIENTSPAFENITIENYNSNKSDAKLTFHDSYEYFKNQSNAIQIDTTKIHTMENSTEVQFNTDTTLITDVSTVNMNYNDTQEDADLPTNITDNSQINMGSKENSPNVKDDNSNNTAKPLLSTTEISTQSESILYEDDNTTSSIIYVTTDETVKENLNKQNDTGNVLTTMHSEIENTDVIKVDKDVNRKNLRSEIEILSEENNYEEPSNEKHVYTSQGNKNNKIKPYFVYEIPEDKPVFIQIHGSSEIQNPHVVPIYDFAPKNAYYNAYNHFGVNNDEETIRAGLERNEDTEFYLQDGVSIDLKPEINNHQDKKKITKNPWKHQWERLLDSSIVYNPNFIVYQHNQSFKRKGKRENSLRHTKKDKDKEKLKKKDKEKQKEKHKENQKEKDNEKQKEIDKTLNETLPDLLKIPFNIKYIPLGALRKSEYNKVTNLRNPKKLGNKSSKSNEEERFGHVQPSKARQIEYYKEEIDGDYKIKNANKRRKQQDVKPKDIDLEYYFGSSKSTVRTDEDFDFEYLDSIEVKRTENDQFIKLVRKDSNDPMDTYNDCEHGCIELNLERPVDAFDEYLDNLIKVLKDMIYKDRIDLVNYNWLLSTVDLESALKKLMDLMDTIKRGNKIHRLDLQLLKYIVYLYDTSNHEIQNTIQSNALQGVNDIVNSFLSLLRRRITLPKMKNKKLGGKLKNPIQYWYKYHIRNVSGNSYKLKKHTKAWKHFNTFLIDLEENLSEFHTALKQIALITTYGKQNWYRDLKNIYLKSATNKELMQVILHLAASRLFYSIEETAKKAEEDELYINNNSEVRRIQHEFIFVLRILHRIKEKNK